MPCISNAQKHTRSHVIQILRCLALTIRHPIRKSEDAVVFLNAPAFATEMARQQGIDNLFIIARHDGIASFEFRSKLGVYPRLFTGHKDGNYLICREGPTFAIAANSGGAVSIIMHGMI